MHFENLSILILALLPFLEPQQSPDQSKTDVRLQMNFEDEEWQDVCTFVAEQFAYSLATSDAGFPTGTFTYADAGENPLPDVLNKLNTQLSLLRPAFSIVRKQRQLYVIPEADINNNLIDITSKNDLNLYGDQEIVLCNFALSQMDKLSALQLANEIREETSKIHRSGFSYFQSSQTLQVRERVATLKRIATLVDKAMKLDESRRQKILSNLASAIGPATAIQLEHISPLDAVGKINELIEKESDLASVSVVADSDHHRLLMFGNPAQTRIIQSISNLIDIPFEQNSRSNTKWIEVSREQLSRIITQAKANSLHSNDSSASHVQMIVPAKRTPGKKHPK